MVRRVQVELSDQSVETLADVARSLQRSRNNLKIGVGTVASELVERLLKDYPQLLKEFFADESPIGTGPHALSKERSRRRTPK